MKIFLADLRAVKTTAELFLKQQAVDGFIIFTVLLQPLLIALLAIFLYRDRASDIAIYLIVGSGMTGLWSGLLFTSAGNIGWERWTGTLELLVATPTSMATIVLGKVLANVLLSFSSMVFGYAMVAVVFRFPLDIVDPAAFAASLLLTVFAFVAVGMLMSPFFAVSPAVQGWVNALEYPVYIAGGFLFPILLLPTWSNPISYLLAPYWAARALHGASSGGEPFSGIVLSWGMLVLLGVVYIIVSRELFRRVLWRIRVDATLGLQ